MRPAGPGIYGWARAVAARLGEGWTAQPGRYSEDLAYLCAPHGGARLHVRDCQNPRRVVVAWALPRDLAPYATIYVSRMVIEVPISPLKSPADAAAQISTQLLPRIDKILQPTRRNAAEHAAYLRRRQVYQAELNGRLGEHHRPRADWAALGLIRFGRDDHLPAGRFHITDRDSVVLEVRLSWAQALRAAGFLAALPGPEPTERRPEN
jgi:hypothetical protein